MNIFVVAVLWTLSTGNKYLNTLHLFENKLEFNKGWIQCKQKANTFLNCSDKYGCFNFYT